MPALVVSPLSRLQETLREKCAGTHAQYCVSLSSEPQCCAIPGVAHHLHLAFNDIAEPREGLVLASQSQIADLIGFARKWDRAGPLLIHCYAGISRSTAAAYVLACALMPERGEAELAAELRARSPMATPNPRVVALGDELLGRQGRMAGAIAAIGRGREAFEGEPFMLPIS